MAKSRNSYLFRHILLSTVSLLIVVAVGAILGAPLIAFVSAYKPDLNGHQVRALAEVLQSSARQSSPEKVVGEMTLPLAGTDRAGDLFILDERGQVLASSYGAKSDFVINSELLPKQPLQVAPLNGIHPEPGDPGIVLFDGEPKRFLLFRPQKNRTGPEKFIIISILIVITLLTIIATGISSFLLIRKLRRHADQVSQVMSRLQAGELNARLPVERRDEFGEIMHQFNLMAGELEKSFYHVREVEKARLHLLQDIGHDLRTPLSSLLQLFEILHDQFGKLTDHEKKRFLATGRRETLFTQRLVENLLFLARVEDPTCPKRDELFSLSSLLQESVDAKRVVTTIEVSCDAPENLEVTGDSQLIQRLVQNAIENSLSFAERTVSVRLKSDAEYVHLQVDDDGPGFSEEALKTFGQKRPTRLVHENEGKRISLGLGSVIMSAIAQLYGGEIRPSNRLEGGLVRGGRVTIILRIPNTTVARQSAA